MLEVITVEGTTVWTVQAKFIFVREYFISPCTLVERDLIHAPLEMPLNVPLSHVRVRLHAFVAKVSRLENNTVDRALSHGKLGGCI